MLKLSRDVLKQLFTYVIYKEVYLLIQSTQWADKIPIAVKNETFSVIRENMLDYKVKINSSL